MSSLTKPVKSTQQLLVRINHPSHVTSLTLPLDQIMTGLDFFRVIRADTSETFHSIDMYTSHEALLLNYEEALTEAVDSTSPCQKSESFSF